MDFLRPHPTTGRPYGPARPFERSFWKGNAQFSALRRPNDSNGINDFNDSTVPTEKHETNGFNDFNGFTVPPEKHETNDFNEITIPRPPNGITKATKPTKKTKRPEKRRFVVFVVYV